jgi:hypothetical protein
MLSSSPTPTEVGVRLCHKPEHRSIGTVYWKSILGGEHSDSLGRTSLVLQLFLSPHQRAFGGSVRYERSMCCSMDIYQCPCQLYKIANFLSPTSAALRFSYDPMTTIQVWEGCRTCDPPMLVQDALAKFQSLQKVYAVLGNPDRCVYCVCNAPRLPLWCCRSDALIVTCNSVIGASTWTTFDVKAGC